MTEQPEDCEYCGNTEEDLSPVYFGESEGFGTFTFTFSPRSTHSVGNRIWDILNNGQRQGDVFVDSVGDKHGPDRIKYTIDLRGDTEPDLWICNVCDDVLRGEKPITHTDKGFDMRNNS